jgi:hypothetical protein
MFTHIDGAPGPRKSKNGLFIANIRPKFQYFFKKMKVVRNLKCLALIIALEKLQ